MNKCETHTRLNSYETQIRCILICQTQFNFSCETHLNIFKRHLKTHLNSYEAQVIWTAAKYICITAKHACIWTVANTHSHIHASDSYETIAREISLNGTKINSSEYPVKETTSNGTINKCSFRAELSRGCCKSSGNVSQILLMIAIFLSIFTLFSPPSSKKEQPLERHKNVSEWLVFINRYRPIKISSQADGKKNVFCLP